MPCLPTTVLVAPEEEAESSPRTEKAFPTVPEFGRPQTEVGLAGASAVTLGFAGVEEEAALKMDSVGVFQAEFALPSETSPVEAGSGMMS